MVGLQSAGFLPTQVWGPSSFYLRPSAGRYEGPTRGRPGHAALRTAPRTPAVVDVNALTRRKKKYPRLPQRNESWTADVRFCQLGRDLKMAAHDATLNLEVNPISG